MVGAAYQLKTVDEPDLMSAKAVCRGALATVSPAAERGRAPPLEHGHSRPVATAAVGVNPLVVICEQTRATDKSPPRRPHSDDADFFSACAGDLTSEGFTSSERVPMPKKCP